MAYFATEYTIHFDDTMAYGSHHFLTAFKLQCAARESFLFGDRVFDVQGVRESLQNVHLFTVDAYARNLNPARVGDRIAILLTLEDWGRASARFCFRALDERGRPICAGFQTIVCADPSSGAPMELPEPLWQAMELLRDIEEVRDRSASFKERLLAGGVALESIFGPAERATSIEFLANRYPHPQVLVASSANNASALPVHESDEPLPSVDAWIFSGQGTLDVSLLCARLREDKSLSRQPSSEWENCRTVLEEWQGPGASALLSGQEEICQQALQRAPNLAQPAIFLQNVLGARLLLQQARRPRVVMGHSFGELAAFCVADCFDLATGLQVVAHRVDALDRHAPADGGLLAVSTTRQRVDMECAFLDLADVVVAGRNTAQQTIVSGPKLQLEQLKMHLTESQISATWIPSPHLFHHPSLRAASQAWYRALRDLPFRNPQTAVYSPIGRRLVVAGEEIAATLAGQLVKPFDLQGAVLDLRDAGVTRLIDCGTSGSLERLLRQIAPESMIIERCEPLVLTGPSKDAKKDGKKEPATSRSMHEASLDGPIERAASVPSLASRPLRSDTPLSPSSPPTPLADEIAIVGQGCILPGGVTSPEQLFAALQEQRDGLVDLRHIDPYWSADFYSETLVPDRSTTHLAGRVRDHDLTPPRGVDAARFADYTRAQKLFCLAVAPLVPSLLHAKRIVGFVGATADGFEDQDEVASLRWAGVDPTRPDIDRRLKTARTAFHGPHAAVMEVIDDLLGPGHTMTLIDAACASSLYTLALGMRALEQQEADAVLVGGLFCPGPGNSCLFSQFKGTTSTGLRPFDARADGVIFSEGSACLVLRTVADAQRHRLPIAALVRGVGLSSDGRSSSANVPQSKGQLLSLQRCYSSYQLDPAQVQAIEGHGTSTPVGDSTELETLAQFFGPHVREPVLLHSLKGLLGHAGWAAGTASVIAVCEYLRTRQFPGQAHHREPSAALRLRSDWLRVPLHSQTLQHPDGLIAVDGFGFGGANAHVVLQASGSGQARSTGRRRKESVANEELVVVSWKQIEPTIRTSQGLAIDRRNLQLDPSHVLLPDLADDMDVSQRLAILLTDHVLRGIPDFRPEWRRSTGFILALAGKTERGVEATLKILERRLRRRLNGLPDVCHALQESAAHARPSGPYTLQCMMPNVASGRAALQANLNGPNFVVDRGVHSLQAGVEAATWLLRDAQDDGTQWVLLATMDVNRWHSTRFVSNEAYEEVAAAFALTTRRFAKEFGLNILATLPEMNHSLQAMLERSRPTPSLARQVEAFAEPLRTPSRAGETARAGRAEERTAAKPLTAVSSVPAESPDVKVYSPLWIESAVDHLRERPSAARPIRPLIISSTDPALLDELVAVLPGYWNHFLWATAGLPTSVPGGTLPSDSFLAVDLQSEASASASLERIVASAPDVVLVVDRVGSWQPFEALKAVATDNGVAELMFLMARGLSERLETGQTELGAVFLNGYRDGLTHPETGSTAGLLKAIQREYPRTRALTLATTETSVSGGLDEWLAERSLESRETEVCQDGSIRRVRRVRPVIFGAPQPNRPALSETSVILATAGARGVTAALLEGLLKQLPATLIAMGRSQPEPGPHESQEGSRERDYYEQALREQPSISLAEMRRRYEQKLGQWETFDHLERFRSLGGAVDYLSADVTNAEQVDRSLRTTIHHRGPIDLLIHGAGIQKSKKLPARDLTEFRQVFQAKVLGLYHLLEGCLRHTGRVPSGHLLTSAYSLFGNDGQHDYGAANETLDRFAALMDHHLRLQGARERWSSLAWLAWDQVGMTRGSEYRALASHRGLSGITVEKGLPLFLDVLQGRAEEAIYLPLTDAEHLRYGVKTIPRASAKPQRTLERSVDLTALDDVLKFHHVRGVPTLPGAWMIHWMVEAALPLTTPSMQPTLVTLENVSFQRFVRPAAQGSLDLRMVVEQDEECIWVWLMGNHLHPSGETLKRDTILAQGQVRFSTSPWMQPSRSSQSAWSGRGREEPRAQEPLVDPYCQPTNSLVTLSGPFDCLRSIRVGAEGRTARVDLGAGSPWSTCIPALLMDGAFRVGAMYADSQNSLFVPVSLERLELPLIDGQSRTFGDGWTIRSGVPRVNERRATWELTELIDEQGQVRLRLEGCQAHRMDAGR